MPSQTQGGAAMNVGRYVLGSIVVFVFFLVIEWIFHGVIMSGWYREVLQLHRPDAYTGIYLIWMLVGFLILAFGYCFIFTKGYENKGIAEGYRYGLYIGVTFSVSASLIEFSVFPFPAKWIIGWIIGYVIIMILAGMIFAAIYRPRIAQAATA
jgi:hypothetical protein